MVKSEEQDEKSDLRDGLSRKKSSKDVSGEKSWVTQHKALGEISQNAAHSLAMGADTDVERDYWNSLKVNAGSASGGNDHIKSTAEVGEGEDESADDPPADLEEDDDPDGTITPTPTSKTKANAPKSKGEEKTPKTTTPKAKKKKPVPEKADDKKKRKNAKADSKKSPGSIGKGSRKKAKVEAAEESPAKGKKRSLPDRTRGDAKSSKKKTSTKKASLDEDGTEVIEVEGAVTVDPDQA